MSAELNPQIWKEKSALKKRVFEAIKFVENGYFNTAIIKSANGTNQKKVFHKLYDSLKYFCRSSKRHSQQEDQVINLAIAFETLLTDYYQPNIRSLIEKNASLALKGVKGKKKHIDEILELYTFRSEIVHEGRSSINQNLDELRQVYSKVFLKIADKAKKIPEKVGDPIHQILKS